MAWKQTTITIVLAGTEELVDALEDDLEEVANMFPAIT